MWDTMTTTPYPAGGRSDTAAVDDEPRAPMGRLLACALDEVDYGIVLLTADADVLHLNHHARRWLAASPVLSSIGNRLRATDPQDMLTLHGGVRDAAERGLRRWLRIGRGASPVVVAMVPVHEGVAAMLLGRTQVCESLSIECFARSHALTPAETRVLAALGGGAVPSAIARTQGVKLSTVRTQIGAIREKVGAASITELVRVVAALPPMVGALRG
jgi:DNA-binding CsgD family transcriptional regulator